MIDSKHPEPASVASEPASVESPRGAADTPDLTREQLLSALDTQIQFEGDSLRNEGWTRWAIWGAIASLTWIATDLMGHTNLSATRTASLGLLVFVFWKLVGQLVWILLPSSRMDVGPARFRLPADTLHPLRPECAADGLHHLLLLFVLAHYKVPGQGFLWAYAIFGVAKNLYVLLFGRLAAAVPTQLNIRATVHFLAAAQLVWLATAGFKICAFVGSSNETYSLADFRLALVLNAGSFLLIRLTTNTSSEHLVNKLTQLRQHTAFERISLLEAIKQAETILNGVTAGEVLKPFVGGVHTELVRVSPLLANFNQLVGQAEERMKLPHPDAEGALLLLDEAHSHLDEIHKQQKRVRAAWTRFAMQAIALGFYSQEVKRDVAILAKGIRTQLDESALVVTQFAERHSAVKAEAYQIARTRPPDSIATPPKPRGYKRRKD